MLRADSIGSLPLPSAGVCHEKIRTIIEYWESIHPTNALPGRQHFDPCAVPKLWRNIVLINVVREPLRFRIRLLGTGIVDYAGEDNTGEWIDERWPGYDNSPFRRVVERRQPSWWRGPSQLRPEKFYFELERVRLPLACDGKTVDMLLCLTVFFGSDGREVYGQF